MVETLEEVMMLSKAILLLGDEHDRLWRGQASFAGKAWSSDEELTARVAEVYIAMATESWPKEDVEGEGVRR